MSSKACLITGASSGIGRACAERLARGGWRVIGTSRAPKESEIKLPSGESIRMIAMDVDDDDSVTRGVAEAAAIGGGRIDALVNCAGVGLGGAIEETSIAEAKALFETNFFGALRACRAVLPAMRAQGSGRIVNIGSLAGIVALPFEGIYTATKFAIEGMTESLRMEAKPFGVWVSVIEPGDFKTGFTQSRKRAAGPGSEAGTEFAADATYGSPYAARFEKVIAATARREQTSPTPEPVAELLARVLEARRPRVRYRVGPGAYAATLKRLLPERLYEAGIERFFFSD